MWAGNVWRVLSGGNGMRIKGKYPPYLDHFRLLWTVFVTSNRENLNGNSAPERARHAFFFLPGRISPFHRDLLPDHPKEAAMIDRASGRKY
jgi:hypothetical protein